MRPLQTSQDPYKKREVGILKRIFRGIFHHTKLLIILCILGVLTFEFLTILTPSTPGWTTSALLDEKGIFPSLLVYNDALWLAFEKKTGITMMYSDDGTTWSSYNFPEELPSYFTEFHNPCWLKRPDGDVWLLWFEKSADPNHISGIYYASLKEDRTLDTPTLLNPLDWRKFSFLSALTTSDGGIAAMGAHYALRLGEDEPTEESYTECTVQVADRNLVWNEPIAVEKNEPVTDSVLTLTRGIDICLDNKGVLWAVYNIYFKTEETLVKTSVDGTSWDESPSIPASFGIEFLQRHNGQYVLFFTKNYREVFMITSSDGQHWSQPTLAAKITHAYSLDAAEAEDGTLWAVIGSDSSWHVKHFTDAQYQKDASEMEAAHTHNILNTLTFVTIVGVMWLLFERSPIYEAGRMKLRGIRKHKELKRKIEFMTMAVVACTFIFTFLFARECAFRFTIAVFFTVSFINYVLLKAESTFFTMVVMIAFIFVMALCWIIALACFI